MKRDKANFDILGRIQYERARRNWTVYTMARNAGVTQSTISTWYRKKLQPSVASLEKICTAFGMSLSEFFMEETETLTKYHEEKASAGNTQFIPSVPQERKNLLLLWERLSVKQRKAVLSLLESMVDEHEV